MTDEEYLTWTENDLLQTERGMEHEECVSNSDVRYLISTMRYLIAEVRRLRQIESATLAGYGGPMPPGLGENSNVSVHPDWKYEFLPDGGYRMVPNK